MQDPLIEPLDEPSRRAPAPSLWRPLRYFAAGRVLLAAVLAALALLSRTGASSWQVDDPPLFLGGALAYLLLALVLLGGSLVERRFSWQLFAQVLVDLTVLLLVMHAAGGPRSGIGVLMIASVAGASVLASGRLSAFFAASATLALLAEAMWRVLVVEPGDYGVLLPAATIGAACFVTAIVVNRLATRLATQERLAWQRGVDLRRQLAVTRLVIAELPQGVVVLDAQGAVRAMNRSAQLLLGARGPWPVLERLARALGLDGRPVGASAPSELVLDAAQLAEGGRTAGARAAVDAPVRHDVRVRVLRPSGAGADAVLVIEDLRGLEERAQQLKLASMGRLSASIAHEIRNPLAAIRHANSLLAEQLAAPAQQRLASIVETNTVRIDRVIRDVLSVARRERPARQPIDVEQFLAALVPELASMAGGRADRIETAVRVRDPLPFDAGQLHQVVVNLVTNALRYSSREPGAVRLEWRRGADDRLEFIVADDGPGLPAELVEHAFEPFFTTEARGTGLGLFLAREICAANEAVLRYEAGPPGGRYKGAFVILPSSTADTVPASE